jgi:polyphosphate kinase
MKALQARRIFMINERQLEPNQAEFVQRYFTSTVLPELDPILFSPKDHRSRCSTTNPCTSPWRYPRQEASARSRWSRCPRIGSTAYVEIPRRKGKAGRVFIALDNVIRACLPQVFRGVVSVSMNAAPTVSSSPAMRSSSSIIGIMESLIEKMASSLKQRRKADAVRFVYDAEMPGSPAGLPGGEVLPGQVRQPHTRGALP